MKRHLKVTGDLGRVTFIVGDFPIQKGLNVGRYLTPTGI
jgi:hypothetical protein